MTVINVRWGREKHAVEFRERMLVDVKLGELRKRCHDLTGVPLGGLTLIYGGATMKDENAPLSCFGIKPGGQITMMGTKPSKNDIQILTTNGNPEEYSLIVKIQTSLEKMHKLVQEYIPAYEKAVHDYLSSNPPPFSLQSIPPARKHLMDTHTLLIENLMQAMLVFDGVVCQPDFEVARATRREAVKETQRLLDVVDDLNAKVKDSDRRP